MAAESQMMGRSPAAFYSPLHSMAWAGAFGAATAGTGGAGAGGGGTSPTPNHAKSSYSSFGYPPTPPKESPGGGTGTPGSLHGDTGGYHGDSGVAGAEDVSGDMKMEMKPSADHLMQSMALSGSLSAYPVTGRSHKIQEGQLSD